MIMQLTLAPALTKQQSTEENGTACFTQNVMSGVAVPIRNPIL